MLEVGTLAYVAGVIDHQGLIRTRTLPHGTELPLVGLHGPNTRMLDFLAELTGTRAITTRRSYSKAGCAEHCKEKHQHITSTSGRWSVTGAKATVLLWNIRPYVHIQVDEVRSALVVGLTTNVKPATITKMADLGWDIPPFGETKSIPGEEDTTMHKCPHCGYRFEDAEGLTRHLDDYGSCPEAP